MTKSRGIEEDMGCATPNPEFGAIWPLTCPYCCRGETMEQVVRIQVRQIVGMMSSISPEGPGCMAVKKQGTCDGAYCLVACLCYAILLGGSWV